MKNCKHLKIILVTEKPKSFVNGKITFGIKKTFVECADCGDILPIKSVLKEERIININ